MPNFNHEKNVLTGIEEKNSIKPEYKKMLNNLLGISGRDNATFTSSKTNNFDLTKLLSESDVKKVLEKKSFSVVLKETQGDIFISLFESSNSVEEFISIADDNGYLLSIANRKLLENDFISNKDKIITKIKKEKNMKIAKWKKIKNRYQDKQALTNSWPLYIGTLFVKVKTTRAIIYAPLILKKVELQINNNNKIILRSIDDSVDINEKLLFLLQNEYKFNIRALDENEKYSLLDVAKQYADDLIDLISQKEIANLNGKFEFNTKNEVKNQDLLSTSGIVLSIMSPSGGKLRDKFISLLENSNIDDLLDVDLTKNLNNEIIEEIKEKNTIYRITPTDFSQERAIHGAFKDHAIIWGPPGTGKSQTISNIIANILSNNLTAIVTSEKKAALDVIKKRMGKLSKYMFFGLTDKKVDKKVFYKSFNDLVDKIASTGNQTDDSRHTYLNDFEWKMFDQKEILSNENLDSLSKVWLSIKEDKNKILNIFNYAKRHKNLINQLNDVNNFDNLLEKNNIRKTGLFFKKYPKDIRKIIKYSNISTENFNNLKLITTIKHKENILNVENYIKNEIDYKNLNRSFEDDIEYLDELLAFKFKSKILALKKDPKFSKQINTFLKNCKSGFRIPYKFINIYSEIIRELFSVFVSTPNTLSSVIDMDKKYDFAIFDEASQLHLEKAIPFISLANISIIAGDGQQMKPTSYFEVRDNSNILEDSEENVDSLLEFAERKGLKAREYMLNKNYRSKSADLMLFSSKEFYESNLDVIDNKEMIGKESIEIFDIKGKWEGRINEKEAEAALTKLLEVKNNFKSIILLTLNSTQKQYIESLIYNDERFTDIIELISNDKVFLRNLENIQGDEADLVIVSIAYDKTARLGSTYVARPEGKNALNVAISRASEKMIIFKSISSSEVTSKNANESIIVLRKWLEYLELSNNDKKTYLISSDKKSETFDSTFEENVYDQIVNNIELSKDYFIETQFKVGSYKIDMAIIDSKSGEFKLGIEVDGYKYHSGFEKMMKDIERQRFIENKGYKPMYRITELDWKTDPKKSINDIKNLIE